MASASNCCDGCQKDEPIKSCCVDCEQLFCHVCTLYHQKVKTTRSHYLFDMTSHTTEFTQNPAGLKCGIDETELAVSLCIDCKQLLCDGCTKRHATLKATKCHWVIGIKLIHPEETDSYQSDVRSVGRERRLSMTSHAYSEHSQAQVQLEKGPYMGMCANEFMSSSPRDKEVTRVRGISILSDGRIVVADYKNRSLKLFNKGLKYEMARDLQEDPRGMTTTSADKVAVTIADKKEIRIYRIENKKIRTHNTFNVKEKPYSIAYDDGHLAVETGEGEDGAVRIYDMIGREKHVIPGNTRSYGQFTGNTIRLALDYKKRKVFVVDVVKESIHCVDFKCILNWSVHVDSPRGIALHHDMLFVASSQNNKIFQMNASDGLVYNLLDEDNRIKRPRYIAFEPVSKKLAVEIDGNHIKLYDIIKPINQTP